LNRPKFPFLLPLRLASKIQKNTLDDPIFKQFVPTVLEERIASDFANDPVQDYVFKKAPKLLSKYRQRVLLLPSKACAMHCRFCFRQNFDYALTKDPLTEEYELIKND